MAKRILAGIFWFLAIGYFWNLVALLIGVPEWPGIVLGVAAAYLFARDPMERIWTRQAPAAPVASVGAAQTA
jgi:hypothetical protein